MAASLELPIEPPTVEDPRSQHCCTSKPPCNRQIILRITTCFVGGDQLDRGGVVLGRGFSAQNKCVEDLAGGEVWKERAAGAGGRAGVWSCAVAVQEANLPIEASEVASKCIPTQTLALCFFRDIIEVASSQTLPHR